MHVCMYVCMYVCYLCMYVIVCMSVCMYVCVCMYIYVCLSVCMYVCYVCMLCMYVCLYVCMCVNVCVYVCDVRMWAYACVRVYVRVAWKAMNKNFKYRNWSQPDIVRRWVLLSSGPLRDWFLNYGFLLFTKLNIQHPSELSTTKEQWTRT
jgi:hypothetical protein